MSLVLVYNADSGFFNAITDSAHKLLSPRTYECRLCLYTYGGVGMKRPWRNFLRSLPHEVRFYHRNEFAQEFGRRDIPLPVILWEDGGDVEVVVSAEAIAACGDEPDSLVCLQRKVSEGMAAYVLA